MKINYNAGKLKAIISDLCVLTGVSMAFLDTDYERICGCTNENDFCSLIQTNEEYHLRCGMSDREVLEKSKKTLCFESHICHAGLYDAAMPIVKDGIFVGSIIMGRVRLAGRCENNELLKNHSLRKLYNNLPEVTEQQIESLRSLLPNILFQDAIIIEYDNIYDKVCGYIESNLKSDLSVNVVCKKFHISKNRLYAMFRDCGGCTVNEYVTDMRIKKAKALLRDTKEPVYIIAEKVGIENYTYFCKLFKRSVNMTPVEYRRSV